MDIGTDAASALTAALRGKKDVDRKLGWSGKYGSRTGWGCNLCEVDDDAALGATLEGPEFRAAFTSSKEHKLWEVIFCEKARANKEFTSMEGCTIVLSDCHNVSEDYSFVSNVKKLIELNEEPLHDSGPDHHQKSSNLNNTLIYIHIHIHKYTFLGFKKQAAYIINEIHTSKSLSTHNSYRTVVVIFFFTN